MVKGNTGTDFDENWLDTVDKICAAEVDEYDRSIKNKPLEGNEIELLLKVVQCVDLTSLTGIETEQAIEDLCARASRPVSEQLLKRLQNRLGKTFNAIQCPAVCVYPKMVKKATQALRILKETKTVDVKVASVAGGFPDGHISLELKLQEIRQAIEDGAQEIDVVIDIDFVLQGKWRDLYQQIRATKQVCGPGVWLKVILKTGELLTLDNVYRASMVSMMGGADTIKTSTGKEAVNATVPVGFVMCKAINDYYRKYGIKVGFKPAGGIRNCADALTWIGLVRDRLGIDWSDSHYFRIGASSLLDDIIAHLEDRAIEQ